MAKKLIRSWLPDADKLGQYRALRWLGPLLQTRGIWHLNRRSAAGAFTIGFFVMFLPIPFQMLVAALMAVGFRCNLPLSISLVWISNPVTMGPMWYLGYLVGAHLLDSPLVAYSMGDDWHELLHLGVSVLKPLVLGCLLCGVISAVIGYLSLNLVWRLSVASDWKRRRALLKRRRAQRQEAREVALSRAANSPGQGPAPAADA